MNSSVGSGLNGNLQSWDSDAVQSVYGSGPACNAPQISGQPQSTTIDSGTSTTLSVTATGTSPFTYQWYRGTKPDASNPVGSNSSSLITGTLTVTTNFWVRVTNDCGIIESNTTTVTVTTTCPKPSITSQSQSTSIQRDENVNLSVSATSETTISYQWYRGTKPDTSNPVGTNSSAFNTGALTTTTSYWVRLTNACGNTDSNTIMVTVLCPKPSITTQPSSATISPGQSRSLSVSASSATTLSYQWYRGTKPDASDPVGSNLPNFNTGSLSSTTDYWVRVSNVCGNTDSTTVTITVCTFPSITVQPANQTVTIGQSASLSVLATATSPVTFSWFEGAVGNTTKPVGSGSNLVTGPLNATTSFWVRISNPCGTLDSAAALVTVVAACASPQITLQPADQNVLAGSTATLTVTATGTSLLYQWFEGGQGDTSKPVGINASVLTTSALSATTRFWVRVSNACGQLDSRVATVVVQPVCTSPGISVQPADQTVAAATTATLSVTATGTSITYQWFEGGLGDTSKPLTINASVITTRVLFATTNFWVRLSNACGQLDSRVAAVVVQQTCTPVGITVQPSPAVVNAGATVVLSVVATGSSPLTFHWFEGARGDTALPVANGDASVLTLTSLTSSSRYWVRITNACGSIDSETAFITVNVLRKRGIKR